MPLSERAPRVRWVHGPAPVCPICGYSCSVRTDSFGTVNWCGCGHVSDVVEQSETLGLAFITNLTKESTVNEESPSIQEISRQVAALITRIDSLQSSVNEIKVSMDKLAEGHTNTREFQAEARRRLDDCAADRRDLWSKINDIRDRELKEIRDKVDEARAEASTATERTQSLSLWLRIACAAYGALLLALFAATLHR
jgi:TolA-binding protein